MDRRAFLATGLVALAGCSGDGGSGTPTDTPTDTPTATPTPGPASLSVAEFSVPSEIEIGSPTTGTVTVENAGGAAGTFESTVSQRVVGGDWQEIDASVSLDVPAGESATTEVELPGHHYIEAGSYRLGATETVARTRFVKARLALGETYTLPNGVEVTASDLRFPGTYVYRDESGAEHEPEPPGGDKWAIATLRAENPTGETAWAPLVSDFAVYHGPQHEYSYRQLENNADRYRGGDIEAGTVREGDLPVNLPTDLEISQLNVEYTASKFDGDITVEWYPESATDA